MVHDAGSRPRENGGWGLQKLFFSIFSNLGASVWSKNKGGRGGGPPLDLPGTFLAIDLTQRIFHVCKWSSLELVIWTQILQLNLYCLDLKKRTVVCRVSRPLFRKNIPSHLQLCSLRLWVRVIMEDKQCVPNKMGGIGRRE